MSISHADYAMRFNAFGFVLSSDLPLADIHNHNMALPIIKFMNILFCFQAHEVTTNSIFIQQNKSSNSKKVHLISALHLHTNFI